MASSRTFLFAYSALWLSVDKHFLKIPSLFGSVLRFESTQQKSIYLKFNTLQHEVLRVYELSLCLKDITVRLH
jgi:hypothetical protein